MKKGKVQQPWYEDQTNFPALIVDSLDDLMIATSGDAAWLDFGNDTHRRTADCRLATKAEHTSIYYSKDTL